MLLLGKLNPCTRLLWRPVQIPMMRSVTTGTPSLKLKKESEMTFSPVNPPDKYLEASRNQNKYLKMLLAEKGKTTTKYVLVLVVFGFGLFWMMLLPHTLLRDTVQEFLQSYRPNGEKIKIRPELVKLINEVMTEMNLEGEKVTNTKAFITSSEDKTTSLGSYSLKTGFLIGFPKIFNYTADHVNENFNKMMTGSGPITPEQLRSSQVATLRENLILSDNAKRFVIARELFRGDKFFVEQDALLPVSILSTVFIIYKVFAVVSALKSRPLLLRILVNVASAGVAFGVYTSARNVRRNKIERTIDKAACELGPAYAAGGYEFYNKMIQRHLVLRDILPDGKKLYNLKGDEYQPLLWGKWRPVWQRREDCEMFVKSFDFMRNK